MGSSSLLLGTCSFSVGAKSMTLLPDNHEMAERERKARSAMLVTSKYTSSNRPLPPPVEPKGKVVKKGVKCKEMNKQWRKGAIEILGLGFKALRTLRSGVVPDVVGDARNKSCWKCPHSIGILEEETDSILHYCLCCGCGKWSDQDEEGSAIEYKNRHSKHHCPLPVPAFVEFEGPTVKNEDPLWRIVARMAKAWGARNNKPD